MPSSKLSSKPVYHSVRLVKMIINCMYVGCLISQWPWELELESDEEVEYFHEAEVERATGYTCLDIRLFFKLFQCLRSLEFTCVAIHLF